MSAAESAIARNREAKARVFARHILNHAARTAAALTPEEWEYIAVTVQKERPSAQTIAEVVRILQEIPL